TTSAHEPARGAFSVRRPPNPPLPSFQYTSKVVPWKFDATKSSAPSPSMSPRSTAIGNAPVGSSTAGGSPAVPPPRPSATGRGPPGAVPPHQGDARLARRAHHRVDRAVTVDVADRDHPGVPGHRNAARQRESAGAVAEQEGDRAGVEAADEQVGDAVAVRVG